MARGEGPGWHHESRRHSEVAKKGRPTHAKKTPKDLSEAYRKMNAAYKKADRAYAEGRDQEGKAFEDEAGKWGKKHHELLNKYDDNRPSFSDGSEIQVQATKSLWVLQERAVKETRSEKKYAADYVTKAQDEFNGEFQGFIDSTKGMSNAEVRTAVARKTKEAQAALRKDPMGTKTYYAAARWEEAQKLMGMPFVVNAR